MKFKLSSTIILSLIILIGGILRLYQLGQNPASMYWDEVSIGLEAYSVAHTGKDTNGLPWLQSVFPAYGDYKAPVLIWLVTPLVKIFDLSPAIIRLPSAILGILSILIMYFLVKQIITFDKKIADNYSTLPLISALIVAIIPWSTHFSRIAFESNISVFFLLLSILFFIYGIKKSGVYLVFSSLAAILGVYSYYSLRVIFPILFLIIGIVFIKQLWNKKLYTITAIILFIILNIPVFTSRFYSESQKYRAGDYSLLSNFHIIQESSSYLDTYQSSFWSKITYHRIWFILRDVLANYFSHFDINFLFVKGDQTTLRQHSGYGGEFFIILLPFFLIGLYFLVKNIKSKLSSITLALFFTSPIAAAFKYEVPNSSRSIYLFIPISIIISIGLIQFIKQLKNRLLKQFTLLVVIMLISVNALFFYLDYFIDYPKKSAKEWLYPNTQAAKYYQKNYLEYPKVLITEYFWLPQLYVFYEFPYLIPHLQDLNYAIRTNNINSFGYPMWDDYLHVPQNTRPNAQILRPEEKAPDNYILKEKLYYPNGEESLYFYVQNHNTIK